MLSTLSILFFVLIAIFGSLRSDAFLTPFNMRSIATDASSYLIIAVGMTFVIMTGGIDLSVAAVVTMAVVRDLYSGARAARLLSLVTMIFSIAPAVAPILGGWVVSTQFFGGTPAWA